MKKIWVLFSFVVFTNHAQTKVESDGLIERCAYWDSENLDSLGHYFNQFSKPFTKETEAYYLYFSARLSNDTIPTTLYREAIEKGLEIKDFTLAGHAYYRLGRMASADGKYDQAMDYYIHAHELFDRFTEDSHFNAVRKKCLTYTSQAYISNQTNNYEKGIEYSLNSLRLADEHSFEDLQLVSYLNLSASYGELSSPDNRLGTQEERDRYGLMAKDYMFKAAHLAENTGDLQRAHRSYSNIGIYYTYKDELDSAIYYLIKAIGIGKAIGDERGLVNDYNMLSFSYQKQGKLKEADEMSEIAMEYAQSVNSNRLVADILLTLGELSAKRNNHEKAKQHLHEALELASEIGIPKIASHALDQLSSIAEDEGDWQHAHELYKKSIAFRDSVASQENFNRIEELKTQYETEKKEQQIVSLEQEAEITDLRIKQQRLLLIGIGSLTLILIFVGYTFYRNRTLRLAQQRLITEHKLLRSQMNPHFLFNALSSIHAFIFKGDKKAAAEYLTTFSELTRDILDHSTKDWITLRKELTTLERYIEVQRLRFPEVTYEIQTNGLVTGDLLVPPMLLQPFVENAFEHGLKDQLAGHIHVRISEKDNQLLLEVEDNGTGLRGHQQVHESKAIDITRERLALLYGKHKAVISITDRKDMKGVLVSIAIPKEELI